MPKLARAETETTIRWDAEEKTAYIWTNDPVYIRKFNRFAEELPEVYRKTEEKVLPGETQCRYTVPSKFISFRKPQTKGFTEEQRAAAAQRMRDYKERMRSDS